MDLRITPNSVANRTIFETQQITSTLANLQEQAATGLKLLRPSDNPVGTVTVMADKSQDLHLDTYLSNINDAQATLNQSVSTLRDVGDILTSARQVAIEGSSAASEASGNEALAQQVDGLLQRLLQDANTQNAGHYLYGGTATQTAPFTVGPTGQVTYVGSSEQAQSPISPQQTVATYYAGNQVFQQQQRGTTLYTGTTGAAAGTGTDSASGQGTLLVSHTTTSFAAGSGVQAGTGSAAGDTIIGPAGAHKLTIIDTSGTGTGGSVALDNGPPTAFTNADANLKVAGPQGEVVFVNTTAITAGFNGTVDITANGNLSVDKGATQVPINFSANQGVTNSATGAVTNVNSTNIRSAGTDQVNYVGTYDTFQILQGIRDDLRNTTLTDAERANSLSQRLGELDRVHTAVLSVVGAQSTSLTNLQALQNRYQNVQLQLRQTTSDLESADISKVVVNLQAQQNLLQAALASAAQINSLSLVNFLGASQTA